MQYSQTYLPFTIEMANELRKTIGEVLEANKESIYKGDVNDFLSKEDGPDKGLLDYVGVLSPYNTCEIYIKEGVPDKVKDFIYQCHAIAHTFLLDKYFSK